MKKINQPHIRTLSMVFRESFGHSNNMYVRVARSKKIKKAKFGHKQFQKRPNPEKWPNNGQISFKKFVKITKLKFRILEMFEICSDLSKTGLKIYSFCQHSKKAKN